MHACLQALSDTPMGLDSPMSSSPPCNSHRSVIPSPSAWTLTNHTLPIPTASSGSCLVSVRHPPPSLIIVVTVLTELHTPCLSPSVDLVLTSLPLVALIRGSPSPYHHQSHRPSPSTHISVPPCGYQHLINICLCSPLTRALPFPHCPQHLANPKAPALPSTPYPPQIGPKLGE